MVKEIKDINNYLNNWLKENDFECCALFDVDFSFDCTNDIIYYSLIVPGDHDELFLKVCQEYKPEIGNCDNFILSFFHELGHYMTQDIFSEKEWEDYYSYFAPDNDSDDSYYLRYYKSPIEYEATMWACDYIVSNSDKVSEWWRGLQPLILDFYKENDITYDYKD